MKSKTRLVTTCTCIYSTAITHFGISFPPQIYLLDFGASRQYSKAFTDKYMDVIHAAAMGNDKEVFEASKRLKFLTGYESKVDNTLPTVITIYYTLYYVIIITGYD